MIVIRVELWPGGDYSRRKTIALGTITNVGGTPTRGEYEARLYGSGNGHVGDISHVYDHLRMRGHLSLAPWRVAFVQGFARKREGAWALLWLVLGDVFGRSR